MLKKVIGLLKRYGVWYTAKKIICKLYISFILGPVRINRKISKRDRAEQEVWHFLNPVCFSIVVPLYNTPETFLREMLESVRMQTYKNWQLCLADGSDQEHPYVQTVCEDYIKRDDRICYRKLDENRGISENTNACIDMAAGEYIALFDHDDLLHPSALFEVMKCIEEKKADFIYTDEATFQGRETHLLSVHRKPDFYMENLRAINYICHFTIFQKTLLNETGMFRKEFDGSQDYDLILRLCETASSIHHIPKVLYFWRAHKDSVALSINSKNYAVRAGLRAVRSHLERRGIVAELSVLQGAMPIFQVEYNLGMISVRDITVLCEKEYKEVSKDVWQAVRDSCSFLLLLKEGLLVPEERCLEQMLMHMAKSEVAAVTGKIVDKKGKVISGGVVLREEQGNLCIHHLYRGLPVTDHGYMNQLTYATGISAICNGCMMIRKEHVITALNEKRNLFDVSDWVKWSIDLRHQGYELINESRASIVTNGRGKLHFLSEQNSFNIFCDFS